MRRYYVRRPYRDRSQMYRAGDIATVHEAEGARLQAAGVLGAMAPEPTPEPESVAPTPTPEPTPEDDPKPTARRSYRQKDT